MLKTTMCAAVLLTACGSDDVPGQHLEGPGLSQTPESSRVVTGSDQEPACDTENLQGVYTLTVALTGCGIVLQQNVFCAGGIETCDELNAPETICKETESHDFDASSCYEQTSTTCWGEVGEYLTTFAATHTDTGATGNVDVVYFDAGVTCTGEFELVKS